MSALAVVGAFTSPALAAEAPTSEGPLARLEACRQQPDDRLRLACYDEVVGKLKDAEKAGDLIVVGRDQVQSVRRDAFGLNLNSLETLARGLAAPAVDSIEARIVTAAATATGRWSMRLDNGATWIQLEAGEMHRQIKPGAVAKIRRGSLGSYIMTIDGIGSFKVRRAE